MDALASRFSLAGVRENPQLDIIGARVLAEEDAMTDKIRRNRTNHLMGESYG